MTGNILPWDQRGYWAAVVETNIAGGTPVVGPMLKKVIVGGSEFGNQTLTRIYGIHVAVLPGLLILCGWAYAVLFGKSGYHGEADHEATEPYWPRQAFYDSSFATGVFGLLGVLTVSTHGYSLDAPADPSSAAYPARPEWYFLPLNLLIHVFEGREIIATMIIPGGIVTGLLLLPLLDKVIPRRLGVRRRLLVFGHAGGLGRDLDRHRALSGCAQRVVPESSSQCRLRGPSSDRCRNPPGHSARRFQLCTRARPALSGR